MCYILLRSEIKNINYNLYVLKTYNYVYKIENEYINKKIKIFHIRNMRKLGINFKKILTELKNRYSK